MPVATTHILHPSNSDTTTQSNAPSNCEKTDKDYTECSTNSDINSTISTQRDSKPKGWRRNDTYSCWCIPDGEPER